MEASTTTFDDLRGLEPPPGEGGGTGEPGGSLRGGEGGVWGGGHAPLTHGSIFPMHSYLSDVEERGRSFRRSDDIVEREASATELNAHTNTRR